MAKVKVHEVPKETEKGNGFIQFGHKKPGTGTYRVSFSF